MTCCVCIPCDACVRRGSFRISAAQKVLLCGTPRFLPALFSGARCRSNVARRSGGRPFADSTPLVTLDLSSFCRRCPRVRRSGAVGGSHGALAAGGETRADAARTHVLPGEGRRRARAGGCAARSGTRRRDEAAGERRGGVSWLERLMRRFGEWGKAGDTGLEIASTLASVVGCGLERTGQDRAGCYRGEAR